MCCFFSRKKNFYDFSKEIKAKLETYLSLQQKKSTQNQNLLVTRMICQQHQQEQQKFLSLFSVVLFIIIIY